jgi:hypothetical protein
LSKKKPKKYVVLIVKLVVPPQNDLIYTCTWYSPVTLNEWVQLWHYQSVF